MIFYNAEKFIHEAIESVFAQTYNGWELLLVDDGSGDSSTAIARQWAQQYPQKVRYFEHDGHQNRGMSASRNLGIRHASGEYIAFLDADDVYLPAKLEQQVTVLNAQPTAAMIYGPTQHWYSWTGKAEDRRRDTMRKLGVTPDSLIQPPRLPTLFLRREAQTPGTCGVLVRRKAIERIGAFEESFRGMFEDQVFFYKVCLSAPVFVESGCWSRYRQHPHSHARVMYRAGQYDRKEGPNPASRVFLSWLKEYLTEQRVLDAELWNALERQLWPYRHPFLYRLSSLMRQVKQIERKLKQMGQRKVE
jgi:glycosyltransferase involved in cell wall biosynthesis